MTLQCGEGSACCLLPAGILSLKGAVRGAAASAELGHGIQAMVYSAKYTGPEILQTSSKESARSPTIRRLPRALASNLALSDLPRVRNLCDPLDDVQKTIHSGAIHPKGKRDERGRWDCSDPV